MSGWQSIRLFQEEDEQPLQCSTKNISCFCCANDAICFGHTDGSLELTDKSSGRLRETFPVFSVTMTHLFYSEARKVLVAVGMDYIDEYLHLKLLSIDGQVGPSSSGGRSEKNQIMREQKLLLDPFSDLDSKKGNRSRIINVSISSDISSIAIQLSHDSAVLYVGDLEKRIDDTLHIRSRYSKGKITFLGLATVSQSHQTGIFVSLDNVSRVSQGRGHVLLNQIVHDKKTMSHNLLYTVHEDIVSVWCQGSDGDYVELLCPIPFGAPEGYAAMGNSGRLSVLKVEDGCCQLATVGNLSSGSLFDPTSPSSVNIVTIDLPAGRIPRQIYCFRHYTCILANQANSSETAFIQCFDCRHHIRAIGRNQQKYVNVRFVSVDLGGITIVTSREAREDIRDGGLLHLQALTELSPTAKLGIFLEKELYEIAKEIASEIAVTDKHGNRLISIVSKLFGDSLYNKGLFSKAMDQYVDTIGFQEPSYVIVKYMKSRQLQDLTYYLEQLIASQHILLFSPSESSHHMQLLLHCYMKQGAYERMRELLFSTQMNLDHKLIIDTLKKGKEFELACDVARKYDMCLDFVCVTFFDLRNAQKSIDYLRTLSWGKVKQVLSRYGRDMIRIEPKLLTELLVDLSSRWFRLDKNQQEYPEEDVTSCPVLYLAHFLLDYPLCFLFFLQRLYSSTLLHSLEEDHYSSIRPQWLIHSFLYFLVSFDSHTMIYPKKELTEVGSEVGKSFSKCEEEVNTFGKHRALSIFKSHELNYNKYQALLMCHTANFEEGFNFLYTLLSSTGEEKSIDSEKIKADKYKNKEESAKKDYATFQSPSDFAIKLLQEGRIPIEVTSSDENPTVPRSFSSFFCTENDSIRNFFLKCSEPLPLKELANNGAKEADLGMW